MFGLSLWELLLFGFLYILAAVVIISLAIFLALRARDALKKTSSSREDGDSGALEH